MFSSNNDHISASYGYIFNLRVIIIILLLLLLFFILGYVIIINFKMGNTKGQKPAQGGPQ